MQLGVRNEELGIEGLGIEGLGIEMDVENCGVQHRSGHAESAGICVVCGRYVGLYDRIGFIVFSRHKNTK